MIRQQKIGLDLGLTIAGWIYLVLVFVFLMAPIFTLIIFSFEDARFPTLPWTGWTTQWYQDLLRDGRLLQSLQRSLIVSPLAAMAATGIGFLAAYAHQFTGATLQCFPHSHRNSFANHNRTDWATTRPNAKRSGRSRMEPRCQ